MLRPNLEWRAGSYYYGGPLIERFYVNGIRVPKSVWRWLYRRMAPC